MNVLAAVAFAKDALSGQTHTGERAPSASRTLFAVVVVAALGWLTGDLIAQGMTANWVASFTALLASVSGGYAVGKFADRPVAGGKPDEP